MTDETFDEKRAQKEVSISNTFILKQFPSLKWKDIECINLQSAHYCKTDEEFCDLRVKLTNIQQHCLDKQKVRDLIERQRAIAQSYNKEGLDKKMKDIGSIRLFLLDEIKTELGL